MKREVNDVMLRRSTVGEFLNTRRVKKGLTQQQVASALNYSTPQFVSNWERGLSLPPMDMLPKLASLYSISPQELIGVLVQYQEKVFDEQKRELNRLFYGSRSK